VNIDRKVSLAVPLTALVLVAAAPSGVLAAPAAGEDAPKEDVAAPEAAQPAVSAEEREAIKQEVLTEVQAQLAADRAEAEEAAARAEADAKAEEAAAVDAEVAVDAEKKDDKPENPLQAENHDEMFGKAALTNDEAYWKPGTGLTFTSDDGRFMLATRLRAQLRYQVDLENEEQEDGSYELADPEQIFQIRRARLQFKAHAFNKHNKMKVEFAFSPRDLSMDADRVPHRTPLLTWYMEFDYLRDFTIRAGQYKIPYSRQRVISSGNLQLVDRALAQGEFNHDRDIGIDFRSKDLAGLGGKLRYYAGVYMGEGRDFGDKNATKDFKLHYLARFEVLPFGKFKDYSEADMERMQKPGLSLGAAYAFHDDSQGLKGVNGDTPTDGGLTSYHSATADYLFKYKGFSSSGEFHWRKGARTAGDVMVEDPTDPTMEVPAEVEAARNGVGWFVQAGYMIPRQPIEVAARYSGIRGTGTDDPGGLTAGDVGDGTYTSLGQRDSLGGGLSYYVAGHPWKIQGDYFKQWNDGTLKDGGHGVRVQLQLAF
jgi:hypothetical protein